jgi:hypothetical protein
MLDMINDKPMLEREKHERYADVKSKHIEEQ